MAVSFVTTPLGDYRGQRKLVPKGQEPDETTSNLLTKNRAEQMRDEAQSGN